MCRRYPVSPRHYSSPLLGVLPMQPRLSADFSLTPLLSIGIAPLILTQPVPALTSDPAYPAALFPKLFRTGSGCYLPFFHREMVPTLTSDLPYPAILFPGPEEVVYTYQ